MKAPPAVEIAGLTVHYGEILALEDTDLVVESGRVCGVVGMNGSGKSTLFKSIMGLVRADAGRIRVHGLDLALAGKNGIVGYVPQNEDVDWAFPISVRDVVMMGRYGHQRWMRRARPADHEAVDTALDRVDLRDFAERRIGALSGGQRKRAFVARALAQGASLMLLDEPFSGVDTRSEAMMVSVLRDLASKGKTILISTHDLRALPELCDEAVLLMHKVLIHAGPREVLKPKNLARAFGLDVVAHPGPPSKEAQG